MDRPHGNYTLQGWGVLGKTGEKRSDVTRVGTGQIYTSLPASFR